MGEILVYGLRDPRTDEYRYIGKSMSGLNRPKAHFTYSHNDSVNIWVLELREQGLCPVIDVLEECLEEELVSKEKFWINFYESTGCKLFNITKYRGWQNEKLAEELNKEKKKLQEELDGIRKESIEISSIGGFIKNRRKELNITQENLAEIAGISENSLYKIERNKSNPTFATLVAILDILGFELKPVFKLKKSDK